MNPAIGSMLERYKCETRHDYENALKEICEAFGSVENVKVMKDKKRRIDGQKKKSVFGTGLVVFASFATAQEAVKRVQWDILESITWALPTDTNAG